MDVIQQELVASVRAALGTHATPEEALAALLAAFVPGFYDSDDLDELTKTTPSHRRALIRNGGFPPGILLGLRKRVWLRHEIHLWVTNQVRIARERGDIERAARFAGARMVEARRVKREAVTGERRVDEVAEAAHEHRP
jgi:predicted DNA-binding transcriptional regulator AlpA